MGLGLILVDPMVLLAYGIGTALCPALGKVSGSAGPEYALLMDRPTLTRRAAARS
jgi:hypothetical protein